MSLRVVPNPNEAELREQMENASRRLALLHNLAPLIEQVEAANDQERIPILAGCLGDIADAYRFGHANITDEYQRLAAACWRFLEDDLRAAAR